MGEGTVLSLTALRSINVLAGHKSFPAYIFGSTHRGELTRRGRLR